MNVVIDAQVVGWYLAELIGAAHPATNSPADLFARLGDEDVGFVDDGGHIEQEWRQVADPDWFNQWYSQLLIDGSVVLIQPSRCRDLLEHLHRNLGFPRTKDVWYIKTAAGVVRDFGPPAHIITEDMDFYEPREKQCSAGRRQRFLHESRGSVARHLGRREGIQVKSVVAHCAT